MGDSGNPLRFIVIDDSSNDAEEVIKLLRRAGHTVTSRRVHDEPGLDAALTAGEWDLVLGKPTLEGFDAGTALARAARDGRDLPFLVLDDGDDAAVEAALDGGARDVVSTDRPGRLVRSMEREMADLGARRERRRLERAYSESERRCRELIERSLDAIALVQDGIIVSANGAWLRRFGADGADAFEGAPLLDQLAGDQDQAVKDHLRRSLQPGTAPAEIEVDTRQSDGSTFRARMEFSPASLAGEPCVQVRIPEETPSRELEDKVRLLRNQDLLTGLFNRQHFLDRLSREAEAAANGDGAALLYIQVDDFDTVKADVGIAASDLVLADLASRLRRRFSVRHHLARFEDHSFTAIIRNLDADALERLGQAVCRLVAAQAVRVEDRPLAVTCSVGIALINETTPGARTVLDRAGRAVEHCAQAGGSRARVYVPEVEEQAEREHQAGWNERLLAALDDGSLRLVYQPVVSLHGEAGEKYEALLRLDGDEGEILPGDFLPAARSAGLMAKFDRWTVAEALRVIGERRREGRDTTLFIKLDGDTLQDAELPAWLAGELRRSGIPGDRLVFEVAEAAAVARPGAAAAMADGLHAMHCGVALDHYGRDPAGERVWARMRADYLKIDGSLVADLTGPGGERVAAISQAAQETGSRTIAEFVESADSLSLLWQSGVHYIQGYFVQRPDAMMAYQFR